MIRRYWRHFLYSCGIPALAWLILTLVHLHQNYEWMKAVKKDFPQASQSELNARRLAALCHDPKLASETQSVCSPYRSVNLLRTLAASTTVATLILLLCVRAIGRRCRGNRRSLLRHFRSVTWLMTAATLVLVVSHAVLLTTTFYYAPVQFFNVIPTGLIGICGLGALVALYQVVRLLLSFVRETPIEIDASPLYPHQAPELWSLVERVARDVGTEPPRNVLAGVNTAFFVTEGPLSGAGAPTAGRTLHLSIPLCRVLSKTELRAVIGHELAHFQGGDTEFSRVFSTLLRNGFNTLQAVIDAGQVGGAAAFPLLPAIWLLSFYLESFSEVEAEISRDRELSADAMGARVTTGRDMAVALAKLFTMIRRGNKPGRNGSRATRTLAQSLA